jgi:hypothetical protein
MEVQMKIIHKDHNEMHRLLVADIGEDDIILGYPFFEAANPLIDWLTGRMCGEVTMMEIQPITKNHPSWIH